MHKNIKLGALAAIVSALFFYSCGERPAGKDEYIKTYKDLIKWIESAESAYLLNECVKKGDTSEWARRLEDEGLKLALTNGFKDKQDVDRVFEIYRGNSEINALQQEVDKSISKILSDALARTQKGK